jgi:hypothetical protein
MNTTESPAAVTPSTRVSWSDYEENQIGKQFIEERKMDPFAAPHELIMVAMRKVLEPHRHRNINTLQACPSLRVKIGNLWLDAMAAQCPEPHIVHVETQSPPDYIDILHRCDLPSLFALVVAKLQEQMGSLKPLLTMLTPPGAPPAGAPLQAPVSLLSAASAKPRRTRVLIVGPLNAQFREIEAKAAEAQLPVELLWLDKDKSNNGVPVSADYVVATSFINHSLNEALKKQLPKGKYFFLNGDGITGVVNKLRDIGALLPPRA